MKLISITIESDGVEKEYRIGNSYFAVVTGKLNGTFGNEKWKIVLDEHFNGYLHRDLSEDIHIGSNLLVEITRIEFPLVYFDAIEIEPTISNLLT